MINIIAIFIFLLVMGLSINTLKAAENYNSSKSNTSTGIINRDVGNLLIDYGYGGEVVNRVTEALARGVTTDGLRTILDGTSARSPTVVEEVLSKLEAELKRLGIRDTPQSAPATGKVIDINPPKTSEVSTPGAGGATPSAADGTIKDILPSKREESVPATTPDTRDAARALVNQELHRPPTSLIENLKAAESKEQREDIRKELQANREALQESAETLRQNLRENAKDIRENFRENVRTTIGHVDHGKTGRIALAHGKGLRMTNRYRSAIARFDHILDRLESRIEKIGIEEQARANKGTIGGLFPPPPVILLIEEANNTQVLNKVKLAELEAKYESLLTGENPQRVAEETRAIAQELKSEIEKIHDLLDDIKQAMTDYNSSISNSSSTL